MPAALQKLKAMGVARRAVIHCPEAGYGLDEANRFCHVPSLRLPEDYIKGTVGAGDAFCAGVLYAAYKEMPLAEALHLGCCTAAASLWGLPIARSFSTTIVSEPNTRLLG